MKWRRGFFRLWVVFAAAWLAGTIAVVAPSVWEQWKLAQTMKEFDDAGFGVPLVPSDCQLARGREGTIRDGSDYERREAKCWYELPGFRRLFPEYADLADKKLTSAPEGRDSAQRSRANEGDWRVAIHWTRNPLASSWRRLCSCMGA
jgi:hypothetical protein